jgi:hypothetical protein
MMSSFTVRPWLDAAAFTHVGDFLAQFGRILAGTADDEARARGVDDDAQFIRRALDFDLAHVHSAQPLRRKARPPIHAQILAEILLIASKPAAPPIADDAESVRVRMYGVCHKD